MHSAAVFTVVTKEMLYHPSKSTALLSESEIAAHLALWYFCLLPMFYVTLE